MTPLNQAQGSLQRIADHDAVVRAWAHIDPARVLAAAGALDLQPARSALHGVPVGVKDVMLTADMPTGYNTNLPCAVAPGVDAACVAMLRKAGALVFGKTETVEFGAIGRPAPTRNPRDLTRTPGGSSSGSAAAVADGHVRLALGTQTGGSIIRPASFCGVYGFKPSWGLVSTEGVRSFAPSLDTVGWFAGTLRDLALPLDIFDPDRGFESPRGLRMAVCRTPMWARAAPETRQAMHHAAQRFRNAGAEVTEIELPPAFDDLHAAHLAIMRAEGGRSFLPLWEIHGAALHENLVGMVRDLCVQDKAALVRAYDQAAACRVLFDELAAGFTAVLAPSAVGEAPDIASGTGDYVFNGMWTLLHTPCLNLPLYTTAAGLPVGVTLTAGRFSDRAVVWAATQLT